MAKFYPIILPSMDASSEMRYFFQKACSPWRRHTEGSDPAVLKSMHTEVGFCKMLFLRHIQVHVSLTRNHICLWFHGRSTSNVQLEMQKYLANSDSIEKNLLLLCLKKKRKIISLCFFCFCMPERDLLLRVASAFIFFSVLKMPPLMWNGTPDPPALLAEAVTHSTESI